MDKICADCRHVEAPALLMCTRVRDAVTGGTVSCYAERGDVLGNLPRVPAGEVRCGAHGIHWAARDE